MAAYVTPGDAAGDVVYANYGRIGDYRLLDDMGVSLEGKIVLVRYGGSPGQMRGMKVREAANRGAVGVVIYTDPEEDGYARTTCYMGINADHRIVDGAPAAEFLATLKDILENPKVMPA